MELGEYRRERKFLLGETMWSQVRKELHGTSKLNDAERKAIQRQLVKLRKQPGSWKKWR